MTDGSDSIDSGGASHNDVDTAQLERMRALVLRAYPDVVPELLTGDTIDELFASIELATTAYRNLVARLESARPRPEPVAVPAGTVAPTAVDPATLSPAEKVRRGLAEHRR